MNNRLPKKFHFFEICTKRISFFRIYLHRFLKIILLEESFCQKMIHHVLWFSNIISKYQNDHQKWNLPIEYLLFITVFVYMYSIILLDVAFLFNQMFLLKIF